MTTGRPYDYVFLGLSLSSSWGNGHATTFRALIRGLDLLGHRILFLERDVPWYEEHRDLVDPDFCDLGLYADLDELKARFADEIATARAVIVGSYVPEGVAVIDFVLATAMGRTAFYDIDTPVTLAGLVDGRTDYLALHQIPCFDLYFSFTGGPILDRLVEDYAARRAVALYCSVEQGRYRATGEAHRWDLGYLGTYSLDRQPTLERLLIEPARRLPEFRFVVAGPRYPSDIDWPDNVERIEHLSPCEHASFYSRQRFTLNVTRADMIAAGWSPSVRLFEAAACGVPILTDTWPGLGDILPLGRAILPVSEAGEVVALIAALSEARRQTVATAARSIVLRSHTGLARAAQFVDALAVVQAQEEPARATA